MLCVICKACAPSLAAVLAPVLLSHLPMSSTLFVNAHTNDVSEWVAVVVVNEVIALLRM